MNSTSTIPKEKQFFWIIDSKDLEKLDTSKLSWEILDKGKYYKRSYSKLFQIINIKKGYSSSIERDSGDLYLLIAQKKRYLALI